MRSYYTKTNTPSWCVLGQSQSTTPNSLDPGRNERKKESILDTLAISALSTKHGKSYTYGDEKIIARGCGVAN